MALRDAVLRSYLRLPEHPTKLRVARWLGRHVFPDAGIPGRAYPGVTLLLHPRDWIEYLILRGEAYEPRTLDFLAANLRPGDTAVLAGVNFGLHSIVAARAVGPRGRVIGVEPQPAARRRAEANFCLNDVQDRITLVDAALGSHEGTVPMAWSDPANAGMASLLDVGPGFMASVRPLHALFREHALGAPRVMLLDVQGYEVQALAGVGSLRPALAVVEVDETCQARSGIPMGEIARALRAMDYALFDIGGAPVGESGPPGGWGTLSELNLVGVQAGASAVWNTPARDRVS